MQSRPDGSLNIARLLFVDKIEVNQIKIFYYSISSLMELINVKQLTKTILTEIIKITN